MAIIKRRIMSRSRILQTIFAYQDDAPDQSTETRMQAQTDMAAYMLADGKEVKIFHDTNMGGTVVEYDDGK